MWVDICVILCVGQPMGQLMDQPIGQPMRQPMGQHMGQAIGQPMGHPARQLMGLLNTVAKPSQNAASNNPSCMVGTCFVVGFCGRQRPVIFSECKGKRSVHPAVISERLLMTPYRLMGLPMQLCHDY